MHFICILCCFCGMILSLCLSCLSFAWNLRKFGPNIKVTNDFFTVGGTVTAAWPTKFIFIVHWRWPKFSLAALWAAQTRNIHFPGISSCLWPCYVAIQVVEVVRLWEIYVSLHSVKSIAEILKNNVLCKECIAQCFIFIRLLPRKTKRLLHSRLRSS